MRGERTGKPRKLPIINGVKVTYRGIDALAKLRREGEVPVAFWVEAGDRITPGMLERARLAVRVESAITISEAGFGVEVLRITDHGELFMADLAAKYTLVLR